MCALPGNIAGLPEDLIHRPLDVVFQTDKQVIVDKYKVQSENSSIIL